MDCAHRYIEKYSDPSEAICKHKEFKDICDSTTLGYLIRAFKNAKIYPEASNLMDMPLGHIKSHINRVLTISICSRTDLYSGKVVPGCCSSPSRNLAACSRCNKWLTSSRECPACHSIYLGGSCKNCYQVYRGLVLVRDHLSCIPLVVIKAEMDGIVDRITGLQYPDFVRSSTGNGQILTTHPGPDAGDLWESLVFQ